MEVNCKPPDLVITRMAVDHLDDLAQLESMAFSRPWSYDALAEELQNPLAVFFVAEDVETERSLGYIGMHHILDEGLIANIVVHPGYRRLGIGTRLVNEVIEYAKTRHQAPDSKSGRPTLRRLRFMRIWALKKRVRRVLRFAQRGRADLFAGIVISKLEELIMPHVA